MEKIIGLIACLLLAGAVAATPEEDHADAVLALGVTNVVVKNPGYFFYGGEYVPPPYTVTREGDFLKINGRYIRFFCKWPQPKGKKWHVTHTMPEVPSSVNEKTSEFDPAVRKYMDDCFDYWLTNHADDDGRWATAMISEVLKLPCVKDAYVDEYGGLTVIWTCGQRQTCFDYSFMASNPSLPSWGPTAFLCLAHFSTRKKNSHVFLIGLLMINTAV